MLTPACHHCWLYCTFTCNQLLVVGCSDRCCCAVCLSACVPACFVAEFLLPLFFANSGIRTNIGTLDSGRYWAITLAITAIACFAKFTPACFVGKLVTKKEWRFCVTLGLLMNTRGLVEVIALNIGLTMVGWGVLGAGEGAGVGDWAGSSGVSGGGAGGEERGGGVPTGWQCRNMPAACRHLRHR